MGFVGRVENLTRFSDFYEEWFYRLFALGSLGSLRKSWMGFVGRVDNLTHFLDFLKYGFIEYCDLVLWVLFGSLGWDLLGEWRT
jgi:hypothetical protein